MRNLVHTIAAIGLLASTAARAEPTCSSPEDQAAFEVTALKSEMIVLAEGCPGADAQYNAFITRFRPSVLADDHVVNAWFKRNYPRTAQKEYDTYITALINEQSDDGLKEGSNFCPRTQLIFAEAAALPDDASLPAYAAAKDVVPPVLGTCAGAPADLRPTKAVARRRIVKHK